MATYIGSVTIKMGVQLEAQSQAQAEELVRECAFARTTGLRYVEDGEGNKVLEEIVRQRHPYEKDVNIHVVM